MPEICTPFISGWPSPRHVCSVALVLNPTTDLASLQFHVTIGDFFEMTHFNHAEILLSSAWQKLAGFVHEGKYQGKS